MSKLPSLVSAILYRRVQGSSYSNKCQDLFWLKSNIIIIITIFIIIIGPKRAIKKEKSWRVQFRVTVSKHSNDKNLQTGNLVQFHWGSPLLEGSSWQSNHHKHPDSLRTNHTHSRLPRLSYVFLYPAYTQVLWDCYNAEQRRFSCLKRRRRIQCALHHFSNNRSMEPPSESSTFATHSSRA